MSLKRREFIISSAATLAAAALLPDSARAARKKPKKPLRILILGGTGFLGPACTESAIARGHKVTHFNSGRTEGQRHELGRPSVVPAGVEQLIGNRDPDKTADDRRNAGKPDAPKDPNSPKGLTQLQGKTWDAVIDTSGYFPRMVKASAELLAPSVRQYIFISSISVYPDYSKPNYDETAQVATLADPTVEEFGKDFANYGGGKALCEKAAEAAMPGRTTSVRAGYIVGPRDSSGRFMYYPVRASLGGSMLMPGTPGDPIQLIDVRDLADWIIHCIEDNITGTFNATGPAKELSMGAMIAAVQQGVGSKADITWIDEAALKEYEIEDSFPLWASPSGKTAGFHRCNVDRALKKGLKFRPIADTALATLQWYKTLPPDLQARVAPQFAPPKDPPPEAAKDAKNPTAAKAEPWLEKEQRVLAALQAKQAKHKP